MIANLDFIYATYMAIVIDNNIISYTKPWSKILFTILSYCIHTKMSTKRTSVSNYNKTLS